MPEDIRELRLFDMIFSQKGSFTRRVIHAVFTIALRLFFRRIETSDVSLAPASGPVIFVLNHPNGLIDPALVFCALPRRVSFLAKSTLFDMPVISFLVRTVEALPLYRRVDQDGDTTLNKRTFEACHDLLKRGRCIALFPEGVSHNATELLPVKTGAARIALGALSIKDAARGGGEADLRSLKIVPVGLYYTSKTSFRSEALLRFGKHLEVNRVELGQDNEPPREEVRLLSNRIGAALRGVTLNVESDAALEEVRKAEQLFSSVYETINFKQSLTETFDLLRRLARVFGHHRAHSPERVDALRKRIIKYEEELRGAGIAPENLSLSAHSGWYVFRHFLLRGLLLAVLSPLALVGAVLHYPAYLLSGGLAKTHRTHGVDEIVSTVKILAAIVLMPLTWVIVTILSYALWNWRVAAVTFPAVIVCGYVAMRFVEEVYDMSGWYKAVFALLRRRGLFLRLLLERRSLHYEIKRLEVPQETDGL